MQKRAWGRERVEALRGKVKDEVSRLITMCCCGGGGGDGGGGGGYRVGECGGGMVEALMAAVGEHIKLAERKERNVEQG